MTSTRLFVRQKVNTRFATRQHGRDLSRSSSQGMRALLGYLGVRAVGCGPVGGLARGATARTIGTRFRYRVVDTQTRTGAHRATVWHHPARPMSGDCWARGAGDRVDVHPYEVREDLPEESANTGRHQGFPNIEHLDGRRRSIQYVLAIIAADTTERLSVMRRERPSSCLERVRNFYSCYN